MARVGLVVGVFEGEPGDQIINLLIESSGVEGENDPPIRMLGVPISCFECEHDGLTGPCQAANALRALRASAKPWPSIVA